MTAFTYSVNFVASSDITTTAAERAAPGDNLTVNPTGTVESTGGNIFLQAGDNVDLQAGSLVKSDTGEVVLKAGESDQDGIGGISVGGAISAATTVALQTIESVSESGSGAVTADGLLLLDSAGTGSFTLNGSNVVNTLAVTSSGSVAFRDTTGLTVGDVTSSQLGAGSFGIFTSNHDVTLIAPSLTVAEGTNAGSGNVTFAADNMALNNAITGTNVTLLSQTAGQHIDLGAADRSGVLGLTAAELDTITASGTLAIGDSTSGDIRVTGPIAPTHASTLVLTTGGSITAVEPEAVTVSGSSGTFTLTFNGQTTSALAFNASAAAVQAALNSLPTIGGSAASVTRTGSTYTIVLGGALDPAQAQQITASASGGASVAVGAGTGSSITETNLALVAGSGVNLTDPGNHVGTLAGSVTGAGSSFTYADADGLTIGIVSGISGIATNGGAVTLTAGGLLDINAAIATSAAVVLNAAGATDLNVALSIGSLDVANAAAIAINGGSVITSGQQLYQTAVTLGGATALSSTGSGAITFDGTVAMSAGLIVSTGGAVTFGGAISGSGVLALDGAGTTTLSATNSYAGETHVDHGTLIVDGSIAASALTTVANGATIDGHGTIGALTVASGGTLSPGNSPGILNTGNLTLAAGAHFKVELGGTTAGPTGYDQVRVTGSVNLAGAVLDASLVNGFNPQSIGAVPFVIIENDGTSDAVSGTFAGLAEGATLTIGGSLFSIDYFGGDGNDVVLTSVDSAPVLHGVATAAAYPGGPPVTLSPGLTVSDPDSTTLTSVIVHVGTGGAAGHGDLLAISAGGLTGTSISASYNAATETLTLSGTDTLAHYSQALDHVTFQTTNFGTDRAQTIEWQADDGAASHNLSALATTAISLPRPPANDFNNDGHSDILWQNADGTPAVWLTDGTSLTSGSNVGFNPGSDWHVIGAGDFNGDGKSDILWQDNNGTIAEWFMDGRNLISGASVSFNPGPSWHAIGSGDFNGDGKADILWQNADGTPAAWLMNGLNILSGANVGFNPGPSWHVIGAADFDGDGKADILWQNADGTPAVWLMNGTSLISGSNVGFNPGPSWHVVGAADFNGDGKADILWQNTDGTPAIWLMNGTNLISGANVGFNPGPAWHVIGAGDFNGDGKADILWQNADGTPAVWLMNGTSLISGANVGFDPGSNWHVIPQHHDLLG